MSENSKRNWHNLTSADLQILFSSDSATGLSEKEAKKRLLRGRNQVWNVESTSIKKYTARSFADLTTLLLIVAVVVSAFFSGIGSAIAVCIMLLVARAARIGAYVISRRELEKNAKEAIPKAKVVRDGNVKEIPADNIVPGDVIVLDAGDIVPCDIRLTAADNVRVDESKLTDVSGIAEKHCNPLSGDNIPISLRSNMLYATSTVISGFGIGMAVATGGSTLAVSRGGVKELSDGDKVPLFDRLSDISRYTELGLILFVLVVSLLGVLIGGKDIYTVFMPSVAMAAASLGEFILAVLFATYAVGFHKGKTADAVLRSGAAAESLANVDTIFLKDCDVLKSGKFSLHSYYTHENFGMMGTKGTKPPYGLMSLACYTTGISPTGAIATGAFGQHVRQKSVLPYQVIQSLCEGVPIIKKNYSSYSIIEHLTAGEEKSDGFDCTLIAKENRFYFVMAGRLEDVLNRCISQSTDKGTLSLDESDKKKILSYADALKKRGVNILAVAKRESPYNNFSRVSVLQTNLIFEGFIAVSNRVDLQTKAFLQDFRKDGGHLVIFSEKSREVEMDKYFLESEGVFTVGDMYSDGGTVPFDEYGTSLVATSTGKDGVRERVRYISYAKENKMRTLYIGNNIQDTFCMQMTDASIAAGDNIPYALRLSANAMTKTSRGATGLILQSRRVMANIKNILMYLISSQIARIVLLLVASLGAFPVPSAQHMVFWGVLLDFSVSIAIAFSKNRGFISVKEKPYPQGMQDILYPLLWGTLAAALAVASPYLGRSVILAASHEFTLTDAQIMECIFIGAILAMIPIAMEYSSTKGIFAGDSKYSKMFILPGVVAVVGIVLSMLLGGTFPGFLMLAFTLIPCGVVVIAMAIVRVITNKSKTKPDESVK